MPDMAQRSLTVLLQIAVRAARTAGVLLARHVGAPARVETKRSAIDLVTDIDRASEQIIRRQFTRATPECGFLGEERGAHGRGAASRWIVDPLDGTMNFVHGVPFFGISIGLERDRRLVVGVVYDPIRKELFTAVRGGGAFLNGRRIRVSPTRQLAGSLLSTGFSSKFRKTPQPYLGWFKTFESRTHAVRRLGSTALSLAYIAAGRLDGFYERDLWPWDVAGGRLLVEEAGGRVTTFGGGTPAIEEPRIVASNGRIHRDILRILSR